MNRQTTGIQLHFQEDRAMTRYRAQAKELASGLSFGLLAHEYASAGPAELAELRRGLSVGGGETLAANQLKHLDDQTLLALAAVQRCRMQPAVAQRCFTDWGVLAVPRFLGRAALAPQFTRFQAEGAWSVSPHTVPHRCLHSVSGAISALLKFQGPNFGCGGGPGGDGESFLAAAALLACEPVPGIWLVLVGHSPEHLPSKEEAETQPWTLHALAMALTAEVLPECESQLRILPPLQTTAADACCESNELFLLKLLPVLAELRQGSTRQRIFSVDETSPWLAFEPAAWNQMPSRLAA